MDKPPAWLTLVANQQYFSIITSKVFVCLMMASTAYTFGLFAGKIAAFQSNLHLVISALCISAIAFFLHPMVKFSPLDNFNRLIYNFCEWVVITLALRFTVYLELGTNQMGADMSHLREAFLSTFFYPGFIFTWILILAIWFTSLIYANNINLLHNIEQINDWENLGSFQKDMYETRHQMTDRVLSIGLLMVFIAVLTNTELNASGVKYRISYIASPQVINILIYFVLAFILLSLSQLASLRTRWWIRKLQISPALGKNWLRYALVFFLLLALISLILPTDYTLGFLESLNLILSTVIAVVFGIISLIIYLYLILLSKLVGTTSPAPFLPMPLQLGKPLANLPPTAGPSWFEQIKSILFWVIFMAIIGAAIVQYIRQNRQLVDKIRQSNLLKPLINMLTRFWQWFMGANRNISENIIRRVRNIIQKQTVPMRNAINTRGTNWRSLTPRQKVICQYQNLTDSGQQFGMGRKPSLTPSHYAAFLNSILPEDAHPEIDNLTTEFLEARYTEHVIPSQSPNRVRQNMQRILAIMRKRDKVKLKKDK